jgi:hypothetical protein
MQVVVVVVRKVAEYIPMEALEAVVQAAVELLEHMLTGFLELLILVGAEVQADITE